MKKILILLLAGLSLNSFAASETYVLDANHTFPKFSYNHLGFSTQLSRFNKTTGSIVFDSTAKTGSVEVVIDTKSIDTGSAMFDGHIQGEDFLDTAKYPTATFKSTKVVFNGSVVSEIQGDLTLSSDHNGLFFVLSSFFFYHRIFCSKVCKEVAKAFYQIIYQSICYWKIFLLC